jgi:hypothetical protein
LISVVNDDEVGLVSLVDDGGEVELVVVCYLL